MTKSNWKQIQANSNLIQHETEKATLINTPPPPPPPPPELAPKVKNNTIVVKKCKTSGNDLLCFMHAAFGEKNGNDNEYKCSDISKKIQELKASIIADVTAKFDGNNDEDKKKLIEEYTSLVTAEIAATTDSNEKHILQTSLDTLNGSTTTDNDKKETIKHCINKIKNTFPLIWLSYAAKMVKKNITVVTKNSSSDNFHINDYSCDSQDNIYIFFDNEGVGHFSRCEQSDYKEKLGAGEINVSNIRLEQVIEEIYAKQRGIIDSMEKHNQEKIDECSYNIKLGVNEHISDLKESCVIVDDDFVKKIIQKKDLELDQLIAKKRTISSQQSILNNNKNYEYKEKDRPLANLPIPEVTKFVNLNTGHQSISATLADTKLGLEGTKKATSSLINEKSVPYKIILNGEKKDNTFFKTKPLEEPCPAVKKIDNASSENKFLQQGYIFGSQNNTNNEERGIMLGTEKEYRSTEEPNTLYTPVYDVNNYVPPTGEKIMSPSVNNSFKTDQPIDKNISADYSNPYIAKLKELQEKAQKIGIFSRITLAIFSWFSSSSAKKRSAIKKLKTISIKNEDKPNYKDDKEMYDLLKKCLDDNKSFVSDIPTLPSENNLIYNHKKMQATQFDPRDMPATKEPQHNSHQLSLQQRNSGESNNSKLGY